MPTVLIAGCGYVGTQLAAGLAAAGHGVLGLRRRSWQAPAGVTPLSADLTDAGSLRAALADVGAIDVAVYAASADARTDEAYRAAYPTGVANLGAVLARADHPPRRLLFTSSTAVYAQDDGSWVDETSPTEPERFPGIRMLEAERAAAESGLPATSLRLGGIYGPGRTRLLERVRSGEARARRGRYTNRIHRDDAAGALRHLVERCLRAEAVEALCLGVDDAPAPEAEVYAWLAERLGAQAPPIVDDPEAGANKRCSNARLRAGGWELRYPSYREGYAAQIEAGPTRP